MGVPVTAGKGQKTRGHHCNRDHAHHGSYRLFYFYETPPKARSTVMSFDRGAALYVGIPCMLVGAGMFLRFIFEIIVDASRWSALELTGIFIVDTLLFITGFLLVRSAARK